VLNLREIFQDTVRYQAATSQGGGPSMRVNKVYALRDCLVNPDYIVAVYPHKFSGSLELDMLKDLDTNNDSYCRIILDGNSFRTSEIIVNSSYEEMIKAFQ
jgi:hypothetical protein